MLKVDCHAHIIDRHRFPFLRGTYQPTASDWNSVEEYLSTLNAHGVDQALIVQPTSAYDYDHACLLHALGVGEGRLRGIARIRFDRIGVDAALLDHPMITGARADLLHDGAAAVGTAEFAQLVDALAQRSMPLLVQSEREQWTTIVPHLRDAGVPIVIDHCGRPEPNLGVSQPGFAAVLELGRAGHFVKLSGVFRFSREAYPHADVDPYIAALLEAFTPQRCLWGSDWPFLRFANRVQYSETQRLVLRRIADASPFDEAARRLFGFSK